MGDLVATYSTKPWQLRGLARQVAIFTAAGFLGGGFLAVMIDIYVQGNWDAGTLQAWTLIPQLAALTCLVVLWRRRESTSFLTLAALLLLIVIEEAFHVLNPLADELVEIARVLSRRSGLRIGLLAVILIYGFVAVIGLSLLWFSYIRGSTAERGVVRNMAILLLLGGVFGGLIGSLGFLGNRLAWTYFEEIGESIVFAIIAGYLAGLVIQLGSERHRVLAPD